METEWTYLGSTLLNLCRNTPEWGMYKPRTAGHSEGQASQYINVADSSWKILLSWGKHAAICCSIDTDLIGISVCR